MRVTPLPLNDPAWLEFVLSHPAASPFHLPAWAGLIADCYGFEAFVLAVRDTDGEILAGAPTVAVQFPLGRLRWVSLPFSDYCPVLTRTDVVDDDVVDKLREHVLASNARELEVRAGLSAADDLHRIEVGYQHVLQLTESPAGLHPNKGHRYSRNRAIRNGVVVTRGTTAQDLATFYRLHTLTRRRHGVPVQPRRFLDLIRDRMIARGNGFVATASLDGDIVASAVYLSHNGTLVAKYHASDPDRQDTGGGYPIDWEMMVGRLYRGLPHAGPWSHRPRC